jgi:hypothetical protein
MSRFHEKYHRSNHHTTPSSSNPDSAHDPIASPSNPFQGDFVLKGAISASVLPTSNYSATFLGAPVGVNTNIPKNYGMDFNQKLTVVGNTYIEGDLNVTGRLLTSNVLVTSNNVTNISTRNLTLTANGFVPALCAVQCGNNVDTNQTNAVAAFYYKDATSPVNQIVPALFIDGYSNPAKFGGTRAGFVGVRTDNPNKEFTVNGAISASAGIFAQNLYIGTNPFPTINYSSQPNIILNSNNPNGGLLLTQDNPNGFTLKISDSAGLDSSPLVVDNNGNVLIGLSATNVNSKVVIVPNSGQVAISAQGDIYSEGGTLYAQYLGIGTKNVSTTADAVINSNNPKGGLFISQNNTNGYTLKISDEAGNDQTPFLIDNFGNVVIGGLTANEKFNVINGNIKSVNGEIQSDIQNSICNFRLIANTKSSMFRNDGQYTHFLLSESTNGTWNSKRPFSINNSTGDVNLVGSIFLKDASGYVGVGISNPTEKLHVTGTIRSELDVTAARNLSAARNVTAGETIHAGGNITCNGNVYFENPNSNLGIGWVPYGYFVDNSNLALRPRAGTDGNIYFQFKVWDGTENYNNTMVIRNKWISAEGNSIVNSKNNAKVWVRFFGRSDDGWCSIENSYNVNSVYRSHYLASDNRTIVPVYTIYFTNAFNNPYYVLTGTANGIVNNTWGGIALPASRYNDRVVVNVIKVENGAFDPTSGCDLIIFGDASNS